MNIAVIFAGGVGKRMGVSVPKQFLKVYGKPILVHTLEKFQFHPEIDKIYVACKEELIPECDKLIKTYGINKVCKIVPGGQTGQDSIYNGLCAALMENSQDSIVLIHDGVRPILSALTISKAIDGVKEYGSAITCTKVFETPVVSHDGYIVSSMPMRKEVYTAQAPQAFYLGEIFEAHQKTRIDNPKYEDIVDSCTLMFRQGKKMHIIEGNRGNMKVTTPEDYIDLLARMSAEDQKQIFQLAKEDDELSIEKKR
ncbi:MAG TPA: IspD/TarI family cytidylyltransferase [Bacilli bacterium]|nr:IspD/TarI family cytidylyltransferase [Bacilli bacterium]